MWQWEAREIDAAPLSVVYQDAKAHIWSWSPCRSHQCVSPRCDLLESKLILLSAPRYCTINTCRWISFSFENSCWTWIDSFFFNFPPDCFLLSADVFNVKGKSLVLLLPLFSGSYNEGVFLDGCGYCRVDSTNGKEFETHKVFLHLANELHCKNTCALFICCL